MGDWIQAILFGLVVISCGVGISCFIMSGTASGQPEYVIKQRVEYFFFGLTSLVAGLLLMYIMA